MSETNASDRAKQIEQARKTYQYFYAFYNIGFASRKYLKLEGKQTDDLVKAKAENKAHQDHHSWGGYLKSLGQRLWGDVDGLFDDAAVQTWTDGYPVPVAMQFVKTAMRYVLNRAECWAVLEGHDIDKTLKDAEAKFHRELRKILHDQPCRGAVIECAHDFAREHYHVDKRELSISDYEAMFQSIKIPETAKLWDQDWNFAYQTVAGSVPCKIECIDTLPDNFPVTEEIYQRVMGSDRSLADDLAAKRVFLLDFSMFELYTGGVADGHQKHIYAPMALFAWRDTSEHNGFGLTPVAVQCGPNPDEFPIFTPGDGWRWKMARYSVQIATGTYRGGYLHFALHIAIERVLIALKRSLAPMHPLHILLNNNFMLTMSANTTTMTFIEEPKGYSVTLMPCWVHATVTQQLEGVAHFRLDQSAPPQMFGGKGLADPSVLPIYPFREDTTKLWEATLQFVEGYIKLYYANDAAVVADKELQQWIWTLRTPDGARFRGIGVNGKVVTVAALVQLVAQLMYQTSAFHAAVNYSGFDCISFPPSGGYAGFAAPPTMDTPNTEASFLAMLPPLEWAWTQFLVELDQITVWANQIGIYHDDYFKDERVKPLADTFATRVNAIAKEVEAANKKRPLPYLHQYPPNVTASIQS